MAIEITERSERALVRVMVSPVMELGFSCYVAAKAGVTSQSGQTWVEPVQREHPDLIPRLGAFWATEGYFEWGELVILADLAGALFDEPEVLFERLDAVAAVPHEVPELPSEGPGIREVLQDRMDRLAASSELRASYIRLLREFWAALKPWWDGGASKQAADLAVSYRHRLARAEDIRAVLPGNHFVHRSVHADLVDRAVANGEAVLVPLALAGAGVAFFSLPHVLIMAAGPDAESGKDRHRERAELAAGKFKVLADPTRLAMLTSFCSLPMSITDLAGYFQLSQPTVSVHVKMLREAGLLEAHKVRGQTLYGSAPEKIRQYVESALAELYAQ